MHNLILPSRMVFLFDESGTPTLNGEHEEQLFLGASVAYDESNEEQILNACSEPMGLEKNSPKKFGMIGTTVAKRITEALSTVPLDIQCSFLDLASPILKQIAQEYMQIGNRIRMKVRGRHEPGIKPRKMNQILYSQIQTNCTTFLISETIARAPDKLLSFELFFDHWVMPDCDKELANKTVLSSLRERMNALISRMGWVGHVDIRAIQFLDNSQPIIQKRKRFIDAVASTVRRSLINSLDSEADQTILDALTGREDGSLFEVKDVTADTAHFLKSYSEELNEKGAEISG